MTRQKKSTIYWGIIGAGQIAGGYDSVDGPDILTHVKALKKNRFVGEISIVDIDDRTRDAFCRKWRITKSFKVTAALLRNGLPDVVSICTPPQTHERIIRHVVAAGVKVILCEKPLADNHTAAQAVVNLCKKNRVKLFINYPRSFDPNHLKAAAIIHKGGIGRIRKAGGYYVKGILNSGSHVFNILRILLGPIIDVKNVGGALSRDKKFPTPDFLVVHKNIDCLMQALNYRDYTVFELDIIGDKGRIRIIDKGAKIEYYTARKDNVYSGYTALLLRNVMQGTFGIMMKYVIDHVAEVFLHKRRYDGAIMDAAAHDMFLIEKILKKGVV